MPIRLRAPRTQDESAFAAAATGVFLLVALAVLLRHEPWRDELHSWLIARDSASPGALFENKRYEGHPSLWYLCLYALTRLWSGPLAMQLFHGGIAAASVFLAARYSPFTRLQRTLLPFGYFFLFEYGIISRNYALGVFFTLAACAVLRARPRRLGLLTFCLVLLAQASLYGFLISAALALAFAVETALEARRGGSRPSAPALALAGAAFAAGLGLSLASMIPPADLTVVDVWRTYWDPPALAKVLTTVWRGLVPVPRPVFHFWGTNILDGLDGAQDVLSLLLLGAGAALLSDCPPALALFGSGSLALLAFEYFKYIGVVRHHGHFFLLLVAAFWLAGSGGEGRGRLSALLRRRALTALLAVHAACGLFASGMDLRWPFSMSAAAARFIADRGLKDMLIVGDQDTKTEALAAYLDRPLYYPASRRWGTFPVWDAKRTQEVPQEEVVHQALDKGREIKGDVLLVLSYELQPDLRRSTKLKDEKTGEVLDYNYVLRMPMDRLPLLASFTGSIVGEESYYLYRVRYTPLARPPS